MTERPDIPEADRAEQEREAWPDDTETVADRQIDPLTADEADQLEQVREALLDDDRDDAKI